MGKHKVVHDAPNTALHQMLSTWRKFAQSRYDLCLASAYESSWSAAELERSTAYAGQYFGWAH